MSPKVVTSSIRNVTGSAKARLDRMSLLKSLQRKIIANYILCKCAFTVEKLAEWIKPFVCIKNSHIIQKVVEK
jgi:hypothetical protein